MVYACLPLTSNLQGHKRFPNCFLSDSLFGKANGNTVNTPIYNESKTFKHSLWAFIDRFELFFFKGGMQHNFNDSSLAMN